MRTHALHTHAFHPAALHSEQSALKRDDHGPRAATARRHNFGIIMGSGLLFVFGIFFLVAAKAPDPVQSLGKSAALPPPPIWTDIVHPIQLFDLAAPELAKATLVYAARRHRIGGGREDILTLGQLKGASPYVRLLLYRVGAEAVPDAPLYVDLTRTAAQADLSIQRSFTPAQLPTRFGAFEAADVDLVGDTFSTVPCLGFRGAALAGKFKILGFACGGQAKPISRPALTCLIDRLDLNEAGADRELATFFAASELKRDPTCFGARLAPTAARASWLDQNDARPPLKRKKLL